MFLFGKGGQENFIGMVVMFYILIWVVVTQVYTFVESSNCTLKICILLQTHSTATWLIGKEKGRKEGRKRKNSPPTPVNLSSAETEIQEPSSVLLYFLLQIPPGHFG